MQLYKDFGAALPDGKLYGPDGVAETVFESEKDGGIPAELNSRVKVTIATLSARGVPAGGPGVLQGFTQKYGVKNPDPYAIYGYEAMTLALDAIERSGTGEPRRHDQGAVRDQGPPACSAPTRSTRTETHADRLWRLLDQGRQLAFDKTIKAAAG